MKYRLLLLMVFATCAMQAQKILGTPPGTIQINDSLYIDKGPVDVLMYAEFRDNVQKLWNYTLHDSLKTLELGEMDKSLMSISLDPAESQRIYNRIIRIENLKIEDSLSITEYFTHPEYQYHPVVGVTKYQAVLYCKWRTDMVNLLWSTKVKKNDYQKIRYRLPTEEEYKMAKAVFLERKKVRFLNEDSPLKIDMEEPRGEDHYVLSRIPEFTIANKYRPESSFPAEEPASNDDYTVFRCICEVQK